MKLNDQVGVTATALASIHALIRNHVLAAERLHGNDTMVLLLAKGGTQKERPEPMSATTGPLMVGDPQLRNSASRATGRWRIQTGILPSGTAFFRPMPLAAAEHPQPLPGMSQASLTGDIDRAFRGSQVKNQVDHCISATLRSIGLVRLDLGQ